MTPDDITRYARHLVLREIGGPGQRALLDSHVVIVGAGGLGGPAGLYLAAAGIGHITVIDDDVVEASNLQRQVQFIHTDIGMGKAEVMADTLGNLNPGIKVIAGDLRLKTDNARELLKNHDVILDGTDSFETRFDTNGAALALGIPLVSGALGRFDGQVGVYPSDGHGPCYRCLVPHIPPRGETCSEVGIVGALAGIVGSLMALETIKLITGAGESLSGKLWLFDGLCAGARTVTLQKDPDCPACS
ncbi:MAG: molybdopterin-synthase adenylyltransferase MoeB [Hyphomonadaceae bacterium]|nr:molybdopterin-synthase adenylyltransferase MoeB [Hyphomonadaceae bacterium]MBC6413038.1 molybdopterin-synthase adenylyltransferase MoeB [Hyphomonadaceae bacterium]